MNEDLIADALRELNEHLTYLNRNLDAVAYNLKKTNDHLDKIGKKIIQIEV